MTEADALEGVETFESVVVVLVLLDADDSDEAFSVTLTLTMPRLVVII